MCPLSPAPVPALSPVSPRYLSSSGPQREAPHTVPSHSASPPAVLTASPRCLDSLLPGTAGHCGGLRRLCGGHRTRDLTRSTGAVILGSPGAQRHTGELQPASPSPSASPPAELRAAARCPPRSFLQTLRQTSAHVPEPQCPLPGLRQEQRPVLGAPRTQRLLVSLVPGSRAPPPA